MSDSSRLSLPRLQALTGLRTGRPTKEPCTLKPQLPGLHGAELVAKRKLGQVGLVWTMISRRIEIGRNVGIWHRAGERTIHF
jgi:hypothetical protein